MKQLAIGVNKTGHSETPVTVRRRLANRLATSRPVDELGLVALNVEQHQDRSMHEVRIILTLLHM